MMGTKKQFVRAIMMMTTKMIEAGGPVAVVEKEIKLNSISLPFILANKKVHLVLIITCEWAGAWDVPNLQIKELGNAVGDLLMII